MQSNKLNISLQKDPTEMLLDILKEIENLCLNKNLHIEMYNDFIYKLPKLGNNQDVFLVGEWINNLCYIETMDIIWC